MFLAETELRSYRNYSFMRQEWNPGINILLGYNAQGKTNLLESIYVLSMAKSHRTAKDREWIQFESNHAVVYGRAIRRTGPVNLELTITDKGKKAKINGVEQRKLSDYIGTLNVVMFAPEDLDLVKGTPQLRRRFLDMEIGQVSPSYLYNLSNYNKILVQRNQLLREIARKEKSTDLLEVWDVQLVDYGIKIHLKRLEFLNKLREWAKEIHQEISNYKEELQISYQSTLHQLGESELEHLKLAFLELLAKNRVKEIERGTSLYGPHRDDLSFTINGQDAQSYGSQGQQRTAALSLKLAEIELINQEIGEYPILLLDDVFSELDETRQTHLLEGFKDKCQIFVTTTSIDGILQDTLRESKILWINAGTIAERSSI